MMKTEKVLFETSANGKRTYHATKKAARDAAKEDPESIVYRCALPNLGAATILALLNGDIIPTRKTVVSGELPLLKLMQDSEPIDDGETRLVHVRTTVADSPKYTRIVVEFDVAVAGADEVVENLRSRGVTLQLHDHDAEEDITKA